MYAGLYPREWEASIAASMQRSDSQNAPKSPGVFDGFGGALADIVPHATLEMLNVWSKVLDTYGKAQSYASMATNPLRKTIAPDLDMDEWKAATIDRIGIDDTGPALRREARKWTPNPAETGIAGQIVFGVGKEVAKLAAHTAITGPLGFWTYGADTGINRADELKDQGVDATTANLAGLLSGAAAGVGARIPAAMGATRLQSAAIGAAVNPALNVAETGGIRLLLQHADYDLIARQYRPFDPLNLTMSAAMGGAFGAAFHRAKPMAAPEAVAEAPVNYDIPPALRKRATPTLTPDEHAAALTMHEVHVRDDDLLTPPGDDAAAYAGRDAQHLARHQLETGQAVDVAAGVDADPAVAAERAEHIARRLNHGDALLGQPLDFGGHPVERLETEYARLTDHQGNNLTDGGRLIDTDLVRELSPEYRQNRLRASDVHQAASALTRELYARALARPVAQGRDNAVLFLAGGGGSGKSTARKILLNASDADIRMDGTFSNLDRARANVEAALASGRSVDIVYVYRSPEKAAAGVIARAGEEGRTVPLDALAEAHEKAPQVVQTLAREYHGNDRVRVRAIWNDGDSATETRFIPLKEIPHVDRRQAEAVFRRTVEMARERGEISPAVWRAFFQGTQRPAHGSDAGRFPQAGPEEHAQDALTGGGSELGASSAPEGGTLLGKVASVVSQMLGRDAPKHPPESAGPQAATPEQQRAFEWMQKHPDALLPGGEGPDGAPLKGPDGELFSPGI